jgi:hypothetical protein
MRVHLRTPQLFQKTASAIAATAVAFALLGTSALAAPPIVRDHTASAGAGAGNNVCVGTVCTATSVFAIVNEPDGSTQACLDITRYEQVETSFVVLGYETGCAPIAASSLSIDTKSLGSAALLPTEITVQAFTCDATGCTPTGTRTALVGANYTGVGELDTYRSNSKSTFGGCTMYFVGKGSSREATATLTVDNRTLEAMGSLFTSNQKIKVLCH